MFHFKWNKPLAIGLKLFLILYDPFMIPVFICMTQWIKATLKFAIDYKYKMRFIVNAKSNPCATVMLS